MRNILKHLYSSFILTLFIFPSSAFAAFVSSVEDNGIVYFLFSAPNKIVRYDSVNETFLSEITLSSIPTVFKVSNNKAYVGFHRELRQIDLSAGTDVFVRNFSTDIRSVVRVADFIYASDQSSDITIINATDLSYVGLFSSFYSGVSFVGSDLQSSFYYRTAGVSPSDIHKVTLNADGTVLSDNDSPYHGAYPSASQLQINASENKVYDNAGIIYFAADLTYAGSLGGSVDAMTLSGDNPIVLRADQLVLYNASGIEQGSISLTAIPDIISSNQQFVFQYTVGNGTVSVSKTDISGFALPTPGEPVNPDGLLYDPDFIESDNSAGLLYLIDVETLSVFRWSEATQGYLTSWSLVNPPTWATFSLNHNRLYLGYNNGKITYFDLSLATPTEVHFTTLATSVRGLLSAGQFLFAADTSGAWDTHYSFDINGVIVDSVDWRDTGAEYVWNSVTNRIYHYRDGTSPNDLEWTEIDPVTGLFGLNGDSPYHGSPIQTRYPIRLSDDGLYVLNGAGQIFDAISLDIVNALSNSITDGIWLNGELVTIDSAGSALQTWATNYELIANYQLADTTTARLAKLNNKIAVIKQQNDIPVITVYDFNNLPDTDGDTVNDLIDNCINDSNVAQTDSDLDQIGDVCDPDDDNDSLPDTLEIDLGLDPLNANDAADDLDTDGFSNYIEYQMGTLLNDSASYPEIISSYVQDFENGWPSDFYNATGSLGWTIHNTGYQSLGSIKSGFITDANSTSDVTFFKYFKAGTMAFSYKVVGDFSYNYTLEVLIDGVPAATNYTTEYLNGYWERRQVSITEGVHEITFRIKANYLYGYETETTFIVDDINFFTDADFDGIADASDNCPAVYNPYQSDFDNDGKGDECDNDPDADFDGIDDSSDNCPSIYNPYQSDFDNDGKGDECDNDPDADFDGIDDTSDNCPAVYNPYQYDYDNDGEGDSCDSNTNYGNTTGSGNEEETDPDDLLIWLGAGSVYNYLLMSIILLFRLSYLRKA